MIYNLEYYEKMLREYSATAQEICRKRWDFLETKMTTPEYIRLGPMINVLDYGSGVGWFRAWRPHWAKVLTYDIAKYPQTGIQLQKYDVVCFWDVLEHISDFKEIEAVLALSDYVALSIPLVKDTLVGWKHFKPREHLVYFTEDSLVALFHQYGFVPLHKSMEIECPPREDILTALFKRGRE